MDELRQRIGVSLQQLETAVFGFVVQQCAQHFAEVLEKVDAWLERERDTKRYRLKGREARQLQTLFGVIQFRRRRYLDRQTGKSVYLLDAVMDLPAQRQISPALSRWALGEAVFSSSYRAAAQGLEAIHGHSVLSHESVRQVVLEVGQQLQDQLKQRLQDPQGERKVKLLFVEVDGLAASLQRPRGNRRRKRWVEEKVLTCHEGWEKRHPASTEYRLVNKRQFRTQDGDFWEAASRFLYSVYDIDEQTLVILNGDRAPWIRQGVEYFPRALYQVDCFHLAREVRQLFGPQVEKRFQAARESGDGARVLAELERAYGQLSDPAKRQKAKALLDDLKTMPEATVDYRRRLEMLGISTVGLRGLGAAESQMDTFSDRVKGRGRSWSECGLASLMEVLCWRNTQTLGQVLDTVEQLLVRVGASLEEVKHTAAHWVHRVVDEGLGSLGATVPIRQAGRTRSGGLSWMMNRLVSGSTG